MSDAPRSAMAHLRVHCPELLELIEALRAAGAAPKLVYLDVGGVVLRGTKPLYFDESLERAFPAPPQRE
jgi:hypothetical protein